MENQNQQKGHFYDLLDLRKDSEKPHIIDQSIRTGVKVVGTNLWVLIFAILVASVGLNVNSTAVIIGAMLISPLMGPIVGLGYGAGVNDFALIKLSFRNMGIFTFISILTSALYFMLSPLDTVTPELLARTSPNLWDVLIAFFGGSAGIIALTRQSISNVAPGVAIATALMPPLCTAGYGIATRNWEYFGGALFLYCINSVFIACSTWLFVKILRLPKHTDLDATTAKRTNRIIALAIFLTIIPSSYLAYNLVEQQSFKSKVEQVLKGFTGESEYVILANSTDSVKREVHLTIGGEDPPKNLAEQMEQKLYQVGLEDTAVIVRYSGSGAIDVGSLKNELRKDLYANMQKQVESLNAENRKLKSNLGIVSENNKKKRELFKEIRAQYPSLGDISITTGFTNAKNTTDAENKQQKNITVITINNSNSLTVADRKRLKNWLTVKFSENPIQLIFLGSSNQVITTEVTENKVNETQVTENQAAVEPS